MKRLRLLWFSLAFVFVALCGMTLLAQNAVQNPIFQTQDLQHWTAGDPSYSIAYSAGGGMSGYCLQKLPGTPSNNGSIVQSVHLIAGYTYQFRANIQANYCSS